jgi:putative ABC transport system permease protein
VSQLPLLYALALVAISVALTLVGGAVPARMAADKDPVEALRSE